MEPVKKHYRYSKKKKKKYRVRKYSREERKKGRKVRVDKTPTIIKKWFVRDKYGHIVSSTTTPLKFKKEHKKRLLGSKKKRRVKKRMIEKRGVGRPKIPLIPKNKTEELQFRLDEQELEKSLEIQQLEHGEAEAKLEELRIKERDLRPKQLTQINKERLRNEIVDLQKQVDYFNR